MTAKAQPGQQVPSVSGAMVAGRFDERLRCPVAWYLIGAVAAAVMAAEIVIVAPALPVWLVFPLFILGAIAIVTWIGRTRVVVTGGELLVRGARLDSRYVAGVVPLEAATMRRLLGRDGDPAAFHATKAWVGPGVQILLADPDDPTPYWAVSTRRPRDLAAALLRPGAAG